MSKLSSFILFFFIAAHSAFPLPPDLWKTAVRPDYAPIDAYVKQCGPSCGKTPEEVADKITATCSSDIEKARAIFDWLAYNIGYDTTYRIASPEEAFSCRRSVCEGYAMLFCQMAERVGLKATFVEGDAKNNMHYRPGYSLGQGGGHAWNIVSLADRDIIIDATWGAGYVSGGAFDRVFKPEWFDPHPAIAVFTHIPSNLNNELLEPTVSDALFRELPYVQPRLAYSGIDPCEIFTFFYEHPECNAVMCYAAFDQALSQGLRLEKIPLCDSLKPDTVYEFRYRPTGDARINISGSTETENADGSLSLFFKGAAGSRINVTQTKVSGILLEYSVTGDAGTFSKRPIIPAEPPRAVRRPEPIFVVMDFVKKGDTPTSGFFISTIESAEEQWKNFERDSSFAASFLHKDKALKKNYKFNPSWRPASGFTIDQVAAYCNWKSAEERLKPCYSLDGDGRIVCDFAASGYRAPTYDEWLYAATDGTGKFPETEETLAESAWFAWDSGSVAHVVGERKPNACGAHDLFGNVPEICYDQASDSYVTVGGDADDTYQDIESMPKTPTDPNGVLNGCIRVVKNAPTDADGLNRIGLAYLSGDDLDQDYAKALTWINAAIDAGNASAVNTLGFMYVNGYGVARDKEKAFSYFKQAAEKSDINACLNVALCLDGGIGTEQNKKEAVPWYEKAAEIGNALAQYDLAVIYAAGETVPENPEAAFRWMGKASEAGNADATAALAAYYQKGYGTPKDDGKALELFMRLARKDSVFGMTHAADAYAAGTGVKQNWETALFWYRSAAIKGDLYAGAKSAACLYYGTGTERDVAKSIETLKKLRDSGWTESNDLIDRASAASAWLSSLGDVGKTVEKNIPEGADPAEYVRVFADLDAALKELSGKGLATPLPYNALTPDEIQKKIVEPLKDALSKKAFPERAKLLLVIEPLDLSGSAALAQTGFRTDALSAKNRRMNGDTYRFDESLFGHYDILVPVRQDCVSKIVSAIAPLIGSGAQTDVLSLDVSLFATAGQKGAAVPAYQACLHDLWKAEIDKGLRPRLILLGNATDANQISLNAIFPGDEAPYAEKINLFGTPLTMTGELSLGFRGSKLLACMLSYPFAPGKAFRVMLDESGVCQGTTTKAPTTVPDGKKLEEMRALKAGAVATIAKPGKVVMVYSVVRPPRQ
jgi:TPR repeat protein